MSADDAVTDAARPRIFAVAPGDPRDKRTWSGTPSVMCDILETRKLLAGSCSASDVTSTSAKAIAHGRARAQYFPFRLTGYSGAVRRAKGIAVARVLDTADCDAALHFMTTHLPLRRVSRAYRNYLYVDTSQRLWGLYAAERQERGARLNRAIQQTERDTFAQMDHIFTISHYLRDDLIEHYGVDPAKITVAGSGRGKIAPFFGEKSYATPKILYVALSWEDKGGQLALEAFRAARARDASLTMTMVCEKAKADELNLHPEPGLTVLTGVSWTLLQQLYDEATLFVMPAPHQPWGLAYIEALTCKVPVVGLDRLSTPELTGHGDFGWRLKEGTVEELAEVIVAAHRSPDKLAAMGERGQAYCLEHFSWDIVVDHIERRVRLDCGLPVETSVSPA